MPRLPFCLCGVRGGDLTQRIESIMAGRRRAELTRTRRAALAISVLVFVATPVVGGALARRPQTGQSAQSERRFDVVSIKPNVSGQPIVAVGLLPLQSSGRFEAPNVTLRQLVWLAYRSDVTSAHISGGPDWIDEDRFDIEAMAPAGSAPATLTGRARAHLLEEMVRAMLADRFKLRISRETRDADVYALVVTRGGPKLTPAKNSQCRAASDEATRCHVMGGGVNRGLQGEGVDTDDIAAFLQSAVLAPERVLNRTGITGLFDVNVTWRRSENARPNPNGPNAGQQADPGGPDLFTALQEQLGLRLERQTAPVNFVVVERVARPSQN